MPSTSAELEELIPFGDSFPLAGQVIATALIVLVSVIAYWMLRAAGRRYVRRSQTKGPEAAARASTLWTVMRRVVLLVIVFIAVLFVFLAWGWSIAPFLGVGTVLAAAIGFGAQDVVRDFLSGFFILMEDQFHVGDVVTLEGSTGTVTTGTVEDIQLRVTLLRDLEGNEHFVPNGQIVVTSNFTSKYAQPLLDVGVAYETDIDHALEVLGDEMSRLASDPDFSEVISGEPEVLGVIELGDSSIKLRARLTTDADQRWAVQREAMKRIKKRFDAEGISIPFPQVTINQKP